MSQGAQAVKGHGAWNVTTFAEARIHASRRFGNSLDDCIRCADGLYCIWVAVENRWAMFAPVDGSEQGHKEVGDMDHGGCVAVVTHFCSAEKLDVALKAWAPTWAWEGLTRVSPSALKQQVFP